MGKKVKKGRGAPKVKRSASGSVNVVPQQCSPSAEAVDVNPVVKEKRSCPHLDKGFDLSKLSEKFGSTEPVRCEDCREGAADRRGGKGKGKHGKKKESESKFLWVCLECGHYACGGVGLPTTPQSHAVHHARQTRHSIAIKLENPHLRWCFPCSTLIPVEKMGENGEHKDVLSDVVKLIKGRTCEKSAVDAEEVWFGSGTGHVTSDYKLTGTLSGGLPAGEGVYAVRGLVNLGNTCFFNSVMQNLLALDTLRDYFLGLDPNFGSLTISLKKVFAETKPGAGLKHVINPKSFFGCVCMKAPQFKGYQQHDAHELLRCLLDSLSTEELGVKKQIRYSQDNVSSSSQGRSFVDDAFGGQISSTVCCLECGHSSTVYEPFLDLSLPVPTKKPPSKKAQPVFRGKKPKLPPKRSARTRQKVGKDAHSSPTQYVSSTSSLSESSSVAESSHPLAAVSDCTLSDACGPTHIADVSSKVSQNSPVVQESGNEQVVDNTGEETSAVLDSFAWMDYLEPEPTLDEQDQTSEYTGSLVLHDSGVPNNTPSSVLIESSAQPETLVCSLISGTDLEPSSASVNSLKDKLPLLVKDSDGLLHPDREEALAHGEIVKEEAEPSSVAAGCEQEELDFNGIGDLFNEPDVVAGPMPRPSLGDDFSQSGNAETGFMAANISESDPDEVDNSDSPVSVESCLAQFIRPECLSDENAWHCENCSKMLWRQRLLAKKEEECLSNGVEIRSESDPQSSSKEISNPVLAKNLSNGDVTSNDAFNSTSGSSVSHNGKVNCLSQNCTEIGTGELDERKSLLSPEEGSHPLEDAYQEPSHSSNSNGACSQAIVNHQVSDSLNGPCIRESNTDKANHHDSEMTTREGESDEVKDDEIDSKSVKVMRNATKRVLLDKAPPILTIHLKRFSQDARGRLSKLNGYVKFRETLDLKPYMNPRRMDSEKYSYSLVGVVEHLGSMRGGHYVAYVRGGKKSKTEAEKETVWYYASDASVRQASLEEVLRSEAYILFYERNSCIELV